MKGKWCLMYIETNIQRSYLVITMAVCVTDCENFHKITYELRMCTNALI